MPVNRLARQLYAQQRKVSARSQSYGSVLRSRSVADRQDAGRQLADQRDVARNALSLLGQALNELRAEPGRVLRFRIEC